MNEYFLIGCIMGIPSWGTVLTFPDWDFPLNIGHFVQLTGVAILITNFIFTFLL